MCGDCARSRLEPVGGVLHCLNERPFIVSYGVLALSPAGCQSGNAARQPKSRRHFDVREGMKAGVIDFLTKPVRDQISSTQLPSQFGSTWSPPGTVQATQLRERYALLTARERQVMALVASGLMNKQVAHELSISELTVKVHRGNAMRKLGAKSVAKLGRIAEILDI
jgi:DNA-binding NarL/FixJ family response regulator